RIFLGNSRITIGTPDRSSAKSCEVVFSETGFVPLERGEGFFRPHRTPYCPPGSLPQGGALRSAGAKTKRPFEFKGDRQKRVTEPMRGNAFQAIVQCNFSRPHERNRAIGSWEPMARSCI